jgi:O-antigen/teichoic acid export membrane protein
MFIRLIKFIAKKIGIDGAIGYTILTRIIQGLGGLITLALIVFFLTKEEQGYYYTFGSIIALQVFFELGLNGIITQYVAHETVHLQWESETKLLGNSEHLSRLSSLLHLCFKVFGTLAIILFLVLTTSGFVFFTRYQRISEVVYWQLPWILVAMATSLMLAINPLFAFLEGLGKVQEVAKIRLIQQTVNIFCIGIVFSLHGSLFALGAASLGSFIVLLCSIIFTYRKALLLFIYRSIGENKINYWKEIFPYQWKIALSWISGYFIFQLFNPVLFATEGAAIAGRMGMTLQALNGISSLSMSWITTKIPLMSSLIAQKNYEKLDAIFNKTVSQFSVINLLLLLFFIMAVGCLVQLKLSFGQRFLPIVPLIMLSVVTYVNQYVYSLATYLRCHKQEPFLVNSMVGGLLSAFSTILLGKYYGMTGVVVGYFSITIFMGLPWGYSIFKRKKLEWHM